ncbi:hypothetical protein [Paenibacillus koleovorans]|uniref:hypothetical protein n=1 Tax=Paenibacillus koleovorans TaxID=121608 RepID=UPI000FDABCBE|nr:hypothetical protein [Paenibacillus koleovorans]
MYEQKTARKAHSASGKGKEPKHKQGSGPMPRLQMLQRMVGNQATMQLLAARDGAGQRAEGRRSEADGSTAERQNGEPVMQRKTVEHRLQDGDHKARIQQVLTDLNTAVMQAYSYVVSVPSLAGFANQKSGYLQEWIKRWNAYVQTADAQMLASSFGYAIETLATEYFFTKPDDVAYQQPRDGTRPDVVLFDGMMDLAWLDITAEDSQGHIFKKDGWEKKIDNFAEVVYPSLDDSTLLMMRDNRANQVANFDLDDLVARKEAARKKYSAQKKYWELKGEELDKRLMALRDKYHLVKLGLEFDKFHLAAAYEVNDFLGNPDINIDSLLSKMPSLLTAMGIGVKKYGYFTGTYASEKTGDYILSRYLPLPEEGEPQAGEKDEKIKIEEEVPGSYQFQ